MTYLDQNAVEDALNAIGNKFLTVSFVAKDGKTREYNGRLNVKKGLTNNERSTIVKETFKKNGIVPIRLQDGNYKAFRVAYVVGIKGNGKVWGETNA